jgi:hypothetical protein
VVRVTDWAPPTCQPRTIHTIAADFVASYSPIEQLHLDLLVHTRSVTTAHITLVRKPGQALGTHRATNAVAADLTQLYIF